MSLIKLFNPSYLKENIKKSRGFILLFLILVPLFTALVTILEVNGNASVNIAEKVEIAWVNLIGMYLIPFILSFTLFGYVYKKNSVDFINSMPLNRKTIFITNTIGGILLITVMQFLTALILVICDALLVNVVIFTKMISDIFILMWVSYVFVFVATNLAMTLSGTFLTQVAMTLLILFLVPFCIDGYNEFSERIDYNFINGDNEFSDSVYETEIAYTMPYGLFHAMVTGADEIYSTSSIVRMVILGIIYFVLGIYMFQNRKMENTEESFSNVKMHIFVKSLTILPMIIFLNLINPDLEFTIFAVALIIVYYFIFDFVVKRKVALKVSIPSLILILIITQGICSVVGLIKDKLPTKTLNKDDVIAVSIGNCRNYSGGSWYYYRDMFSELEYYFDNQELIDIIFESGDYVEEMYKIDEEKVPTAKATEIVVTKEVDTKTVASDIMIDEEYEKTSVIQVTFKTKTGKKLKADIEILEKDFDKIIEIFEKDENFVSTVKERFVHEGVTTIEQILCDDETEEIIRNEIRTKLETMPVKEIYTTLRTSDSCGVYQYYYENHKLISNSVSITITDKLFELGTEILNKNTEEVVKKAVEEDVYMHFYVKIPETYTNKYTGYMDFSEDIIANFILENANEKFDITKEYYILRGNLGSYGSIYFYTNKIEEIDKMVDAMNNDVYYYEDVNL